MTEKTIKINETEEFKTWLASWQKMIDTYMEKNFPVLNRNVLEIKTGSKYIKVIASGSVMAFVDNSNGDIYKPAGYKSPAKHVRGNINDNNKGMGCVNPYGVAYLR